MASNHEKTMEGMAFASAGKMAQGEMLKADDPNRAVAASAMDNAQHFIDEALQRLKIDPTNTREVDAAYKKITGDPKETQQDFDTRRKETHVEAAKQLYEEAVTGTNFKGQAVSPETQKLAIQDVSEQLRMGGFDDSKGGLMLADGLKTLSTDNPPSTQQFEDLTNKLTQAGGAATICRSGNAQTDRRRERSYLIHKLVAWSV